MPNIKRYTDFPEFWENEFQAGTYLGAIIDGEGHICNKKYPTCHKRHIEIVSKEYDIIEATASACKELGIVFTCVKYQRALTNERPGYIEYRLTIHGKKNLEKVYTHATIMSVRKRKTLHDALLTFVRKSYPSRQKAII